MAKGEEKAQTKKPVADDLEPYRRLIEIQKQLVHLSKKNEATRREFDALRERLSREWTAPPRGKGGIPQRLQRSVSKLFRQLSRLAAAEKPARPPKHKSSAYAKSH